MKPAVPIEKLQVAAYTVPTDAPESDGTLDWDATTIVVVHAHAGGETGLGYTYGPAACAGATRWRRRARRRRCTRRCATPARPAWARSR